MRTPEQILDEELEKMKPNQMIELFYKINRREIVKIIEEIQNEAYDAGKMKAYSNR